MTIPEIKISFDFFTEQYNLLTEAGRPPRRLLALGEVGTIFKNTVDAVGKIMKEGKFNNKPLTSSDGDVVPGFKTQNILNKYVISILLPNDPTFFDEVAKSKVKQAEKLDDKNKPTGEFFTYFEEYNNTMPGLATEFLKLHGVKDGTDYLPELSREDVKITLDSTERMARAILLFLKKFPDYIKSKEFQQEMINPQGIADFIIRNRSGDTGVSQKNLQAEEKKYKMPWQEIQSIRTNVREELIQINRQTAYKRIKLMYLLKKKGYIEDVPEEPKNPEDALVDQNFIFLRNIVAILDQIVHYIQIESRLREYLKEAGIDNPYTEDNIQLLRTHARIFHDTLHSLNIPLSMGVVFDMMFLQPSYLPYLYSHFEDFAEDGISVQTFDSEIESIKDDFETEIKTYNANDDEDEDDDDEDNYTRKKKKVIKLPDRYFPVLDSIISNLSPLFRKESKEEFPGFDESIITKILDTPEKLQNFSTWYDSIFTVDRDYIDMDNISKHAKMTPEEREQLQIIRRYEYEQNLKQKKIREAKLKAKEQGKLDDDEVINDEDDLLSGIESHEFGEDKTEKLVNAFARVTDLQNRAKSSDKGKYIPDEELERFKQTQSRLLDLEDEDEDEESYVMSYMTEQIKKDNLNKPSGKFVDRGFKKVKNYNQWMIINS